MSNMENSILEKKPELSIYSGMNEVFGLVQISISEMKNGEKITVRDLIDKISAQLPKMQAGNIANLVMMYVHSSKEVSVEVGRGGGIYKGGKPRRVDPRPRCPTCTQVLNQKMKSSRVQEQISPEETLH